MKRIYVGLFLVAFTTLMLELTLIRVFDVVWYPNMAYMVITMAMFCFGLSGIYVSVKPIKSSANIHSLLAHYSHVFALFIFLIFPVMNYLPFDFHLFATNPVKGIFYFLGVYLVLALPFFFAGLIFTVVFSVYSQNIQRLYFFDLAGAAIGCYLVAPLLPVIGTGGLIFLATALVLVASGLFSQSKVWLVSSVLLAGIVVAIPFTLSPDTYLEFKQHSSKRGLKYFKENNLVERTHWDPISKIDIVNGGAKKFIAYDGGSQSSYIYPFDGDLKELRKVIGQNYLDHCWGKMVLASHYLKKDSGQKVLVIGSAGGQETKVALVYGAKHVDAVELVDYVVTIGKEDYAKYNGGIFTHPNVNSVKGEGRSFLRSSKNIYDIIQIFSNHTSSSIASGSGAMSPHYLQTVEAYEEYFNKLADDGILHINHHVYPRMISSAATAWKDMGRNDFLKHVVVFEKENVVDNLPTVLIKMSPWGKSEVETLQNFLGKGNTLVINPLDSTNNYLSPDFFSGDIPQSIAKQMSFRIAPSTDDRPYFNFLRKHLDEVEIDNKNFVNYSTAGLLNSQLENGIPMDIIHLIVTGIASLVFAVAFILVPLFFSDVGREKWVGKATTLTYFSCLGAGFIVLELVFIQIFMKLIGFPLYTYSTVIFSLLIAAAIGSYSSAKLGISLKKRWHWPFIGIFCSGLLLLFGQSFITGLFLTYSVTVRMAVTACLIFPLGFFLGMPFPLGILAIENKTNGTIGWAWGMNGLFTVVGGLLSVLLSIFFGFKITVLAALMIYGIAFAMISKLRKG